MIDIEKFICSLLADHPEGVAVRGDIHRALKEQGLEYKDGKIVPIEHKTELKESEDEKIRKSIIGFLNTISSLKDGKTVSNEDFDSKTILEWVAWLEKQGERELVNFDEAEKEKSDFVGGGFLKCFRNFLDFKKFETYWLEYIGDDNYNVRSDNLLGKTYHITPYQLYTIFRKQTGFKKQGESAEINPDEIIEECHQDNADHIIDIVTEQRKPAEWSDPYNGVSFVYNNHTWGMCARDNGVEILIDSKIKAFISLEKSFIYPTTLISKSALEAINEEKVDNANKIEPKFKVGDTIINIYYRWDGKHRIKEIKDGKYIFDSKSYINIKEQDSWELANKVEPKFKVGNWVVDKIVGGVWHIDSFDKKNYQVSDGKGNYNYFPISKQDEIHIWTIEDAKDGDVLCYKDEISLYKHNIKNCTKPKTFGGFVYYCCYDGKKFITNSFYSLIEQDKINIHPATKEQCGLLFQKMKEAGYEWDNEKKQVITLNHFVDNNDMVEPKFHVGDWIIQEYLGVYKIIEICKSWYEVVDNQNNHYSIKFDKEYMCHPWTIEDAKDGDIILAHSKSSSFSFICIFSGLKDEKLCKYCYVESEDLDQWNFNRSNGFVRLTWYDFYPATKEQCDILFKKMKEAGYMWDSEKKELIKIEQV